MAKRYPVPTGYAPAGVSYYNSGNTKPKRKVYAPPTGYAPGGVEYGPLRRKPKKKLQTSVYTPGKGNRGGRPIGTTESGEVIYQDPNTGEIYTQAEKRVHERTDPILQELARREAEERARAQADAQAYSTQVGTAYANERAPTAALYDHAVQQAKDVENAIAAKFGKTGETNVDALKAKLAEIGGAAGGDEAAQAYQGAGNANYAIGMNDVARLISRGAEAQNYLEREGLNAQQGIQADLADLLQQIAGDYSDQRFEISAGMPGQIQDEYDTMLADARGQAQGKYERAFTEREYRDALKASKSAAQSDNLKELRRQYEADRDFLQKQQALNYNNPERLAELKAQEKALDRQLKIDIANASNQTRVDIANASQAGQDARRQPRSGVVSSTLSKGSKWLVDETGTVMTDAQGRKRVNPAYKPGKGAKGGETVATAGSAKRNRVVQSAYGAIVNTSGGFIKQRYGNAKNADMEIQRQINATLQGMGVPPNGPEGTQIRRAIYRRINGMRIAVYDPKQKKIVYKIYEMPSWVK